MAPLNLDGIQPRFRAMIGTGGVGSGMFFALQGNETLGREESRGGILLDRRDYCKLHIIAHYTQVFLGPNFHTILLSKVGGDPTGERLVEEIRAAGMDARFLQTIPGEQTMFSFCFTYPDGTGGNITNADSACNRVDAATIDQASREFEMYAGLGIALAAPEVPLAARARLLDLGTQHAFFRAGSFVSAEIQPALEMGLFGKLDLVALNLDEAARLVEHDPRLADNEAAGMNPSDLISRVIERIAKEFPRLGVSITAGKLGSWSWDGNEIHFCGAFPAQAASTAGAGDAHLAGILAGITAGLTLAEAQELGSLAAALSVTSPHTIAPQVERRALRDFANQISARLSPAVTHLLQDPD